MQDVDYQFLGKQNPPRWSLPDFRATEIHAMRVAPRAELQAGRFPALSASQFLESAAMSQVLLGGWQFLALGRSGHQGHKSAMLGFDQAEHAVQAVADRLAVQG